MASNTVDRKNVNDDILDEGVWVENGKTGVTHYVTHKAHLHRLLAPEEAGGSAGKKVAAPAAAPAEKPKAGHAPGA